ncbi:MAG: YciI family protein [Caldilineaceae bacterium]
MRVMVFVKANNETEAGVMPTTEDLAEMGVFNEELVKAGVMLAGEGLHPTSKGVRIYFDGKQRNVVDGPFTEAKEVVAGFWIWQVKSMEEAVEYKRSPFQEGQLERDPLFEADDFGDELTPELRRESMTRRVCGHNRKPTHNSRTHKNG